MIFSLFKVDSLSLIAIALIGVIGIIIGAFSYRYMDGDRLHKQFIIQIGLLCSTLALLAVTDNIILFFILWCVCDLILVKLMLHKSEWLESRASALLTVKVFSIGFICLGTGLGLLWYATGETSIKAILAFSSTQHYITISALTLILTSAMVQSGLWPFNSWLLSSMNSPTPVSALMHAGLVNGGGLLLIRFAPLYFSTPGMLSIIFTVGIISASVGALWKLIQSDIKRMLACSTMSQMGFMFVQCGLGLFPAALAHLCWHGFFKAYLFLASGSAAQEKRQSITQPISLLSFLLALSCGLAGSYFFTLANHTPWITPTTFMFLTGIAFIAISQFALVLTQKAPKYFFLTFLLSSAIGYMYGLSVWVIENAIYPLNLMQSQPLNTFHYIAMVFLTTLWMVMTLRNSIPSNEKFADIFSYFYVKSLNASQPHPTTITKNHNSYRYK